MMKEEHIEKIEAYLNSEISHDTLKDYAAKEGITDLSSKIEWVENLILAVEADGLRDQLKEILPVTTKPATKTRTLKPLKIIAGIAAALALLFIGYQGFQDGKGDKGLYAQFEYEDPGLPITMSESKNYKLYDALTYFGENNYSKCIEKLKEIDNSQNDTISYYLGASYYYENNFAKAIKNLNSSNGDKSAFAEESEWLIILSSLKNDQSKNAMDILNKITTEPQHQFYKQAVELKNKIKN